MLATFGFTNFVEICLINAMSPFDAFPLLTAPFRHLHCQESQPASRQAGRQECWYNRVWSKVRRAVGGCGNGDEGQGIPMPLRSAGCTNKWWCGEGEGRVIIRWRWIDDKWGCGTKLGKPEERELVAGMKIEFANDFPSSSFSGGWWCGVVSNGSSNVIKIIFNNREFVCLPNVSPILI